MNFDFARPHGGFALVAVTLLMLACESAAPPAGTAGSTATSAAAPAAGVTAPPARRLGALTGDAWLDAHHEHCREALRKAFPNCTNQKSVAALLSGPGGLVALSDRLADRKTCEASSDCSGAKTNVLVKGDEAAKTCTAEFVYSSLTVNRSAKTKDVSWALQVQTGGGSASFVGDGIAFSQRQPPSGTPVYVDPAKLWTPSSSGTTARAVIKDDLLASELQKNPEFYSACHYPVVDWTSPKDKTPVRCCPVDPIIINQP